MEAGWIVIPDHNNSKWCEVMPDHNNRMNNVR
jgi:hypothetical protein